MCGLIGMIAKSKSGFWGVDKEVFTQMLYADAVRGKDATGAFAVNKEGNVHWLKQACPSGWFVSSKAYKDFEDKMVSDFHVVIGHNRKATHGDKKDADAHPFIKDHITLVHNGMIRNHKELCKESTVDSNAVANALAETTNVESLLRDIEGAFAFIWYDAKTRKLHFIRNKERPLSIVETDKCWYLASESLLAGWVLTRNNQKITNKTDCVENTLYTIDLEEFKLTEETLDLQKKPLPQQTNYHENNYGTAWQTAADTTATLFVDKEAVGGLLNLWADINADILVEITNYEDYTQPSFNKSHVEITGKLLNCDLKGPEIKAYVPKDEVTSMLESCVIYGKIRHVSYGNKPTIYINGARATDVVESKNGVFISDEHYMSAHFPINCTTCNKTRLEYDDLADWEVHYKFKWSLDPEVSIVCPHCLEKEEACILALN